MKSKRNQIYLIAWGLCAILAIALIILVFTDRKKNQERLEQAILEAQLQSSDAEGNSDGDSQENGNLRKASNIYADLLSQLPLNNFVCWGDNETVGNMRGSLPKSFGEVVNGQLIELLSGSFGEVVEIEKNNIPPMIVTNMGYSKEGMDEILVRAGVDKLEVGEWALIPEDKEPVNLVFRNENSGTTLRFARQEGSNFGQVKILDVEGIITQGKGEYDEDHPRFAFVRDRAGDSFQVGVGTEIEITSTSKYIGNIPIFFFEDNSVDSVDSSDEFISDLERLVQRYTEIGENEGSSEELPYVVICTVDEESELNDALREAFGDHYIRHDIYAYDMMGDDYKELAQKVYANLDGQGCFDEIKGMIVKAAEELKTE